MDDPLGILIENIIIVSALIAWVLIFIISLVATITRMIHRIRGKTFILWGREGHGESRYGGKA